MTRLYLVIINILNSVDLRKKLMAFFENSNLFDASVVLELMVNDTYLLKERSMLLAKSKRYKEAIALCLD